MDETIKNKKNIIIKNIIFFTITIAIITAITLYVCNDNFRQAIDTYVFKKELSHDEATYIELDGDTNQYVYAYDKYIVTLKKGMLNSYISSGSKVSTTEVTIGNPIFNSNGRYICLAEKDGQKIYLISGENIIWQKEVEGNISKISVNKNGYVSAIIKGTTYKTVIITFNAEGKELFKTYLSTTNAVASDISNDNKYLAIAEINSSGSTIGSNVKIISIQKAGTDPTNSIVYTYKSEANNLITNIKYQDRGVLACMYSDGIHLIYDQKDELLINSDNDTNYMDINLKNMAVIVQNKQKGLLNSQSQVIIKDINNKSESLYTIENLISGLYVSESKIAASIGSEIHFIDSSGCVKKKYKANQEITNIVLGDSIAGIVYRDKVDVIGL